MINLKFHQRLELVCTEIVNVSARAGRNSSDIQLVAVSKNHPPNAIEEVIDAGHLLFGESRVQEARVKIPLLPSKARWHFIGHLQTNKIRHALPLFELFHGIDSLVLAREINRIADELGLYPEILLEVNVAGESSKFGFMQETLRQQMEDLLALNRLQIKGLMTIAPLAEKSESSRKHFARLREVRDELQTAFGVSLPHLSMGMSNDFIVGIEEGATLIRVGTAIFGKRGAIKLKPQQTFSDD